MKFANSIFKAFVVSMLVVAQMHFAFAQTASILPPAKTTFLDKNGKPLTKGTVDFYIPNSTVRKTTWQDAAETVPNLNPVVLDESGRALILGSGIYRQVVKDRLNNIIWDQVTSSTGTSGGGGSTATGDGDLVGTIKPWAGMIAPNQYLFTYGQEVSRTTYAALYAAITYAQPAFCSTGSPILTGLTDTTNFWIGSAVEVSCLAAGASTIISKTSTTVTLAANANVTVNTLATFMPWGRGNGATTFNLPDLRGQVLAGNNNMGGTASSNLDTSSFGAQNPNSAGASGGTPTKALITANLPPQTPAGTITNGAITITHNAAQLNTTYATPNNTTGIAQPIAATITASQAASTFTGTAFAGQTSTAFSIVQPTRTTNYIIKVTPDSNAATASGVTSLGSMTGDIACGSGVTCTGNILSVNLSGLPLAASGSSGTVFSSTCSASTWFSTLGNGTGNFGCSQPSFTDLSGSIAIGQITSNLITYAKIQQGTGLSVVGVTGNVAANNADIVAASDNTVLRRSGTSVAFGTVLYSTLDTTTIATAAQYLAGTASKLVQAGTIYAAEVTTTFGATTTFDFSLFINTVVTLTANITTQTLSNVTAGKAGTITFIQDGTGSRTTVWNSVFKFAGGTTPSLTTTAAAVDVLSYSCRTATFCVASLIKDVK